MSKVEKVKTRKSQKCLVDGVKFLWKNYQDNSPQEYFKSMAVPQMQQLISTKKIFEKLVDLNS